MDRKRRRHSGSKYASRSVYLACAAVLCAGWLLYWALPSKTLARGVPDAAAVAAGVGTAAVRPAAIGRPPRAIYPLSVIRGGAYSAGELNAALRADPVAAAHYAVFDRTHVSLAKAPEPAAFYVSYRQGDRIYWTRRRVRLAAEEALLTDGVHLARARCGNRLSLTAPDAAQAGEPGIDLDIPEPPPTGDGTAAVPLVVHEIFPALLADWLPTPGPGGDVGGPSGMAFPTFGAGAPPPGFKFPLLPEILVPPPMPVVWPIDFSTVPVPPVGPGVWWIQPTPPAFGSAAGGAIGPPPGETAPAEAILGLPPFPGMTTLPPIATVLVPGLATMPAITSVLGIPTYRNVTVGPPPPSSASETGPQPEVLPTPNPPPPDTQNSPEPASAALLLCGVIVLIFGGRFRRRLD